MRKNALSQKAFLIRKLILDISYNAHVGHIASALSVADILSVLYFKTLKNKDRFILSKGPAAAALYATLYLKKYISKKQLFSYCMDNGALGVHPDYNPAIGMEFTTGSLGHGLPVGCGLALGLPGQYIYILVSDAELNEGSCWEAVMFAAHHKLGNLTVIVDDNGNQAFGKTKDVLDIQPIAKKFKTFGWNAITVDGHNHKELINAFITSSKKPKAIIAKTVSGYGVSFMKGSVDWHYWPMDEKQYNQALQDIRKI